MHDMRNLIIELDKLKSVYRQSYLSDMSRKENSAEHSWHLAVALMAMKDIIPATVNIDRAIRIALLHDVCEIGVGDISVYDAMRSEITVKEAVYMTGFAQKYDAFGKEALEVWHEYEDQESEESRWVKVVDRLLPFMLNIATEGKSWQEQGIRRSQVLELNSGIAKISPEVYAWIKNEVDDAVEKGWLLDA